MNNKDKLRLRIFEAYKIYKIKVNNNVDDEVLNYLATCKEMWGLKTLANFILTYKRSCKTTELCGAQSAKHFQIIREHGFIEKSDNEIRNTFRINGEEYREIIGFDKNKRIIPQKPNNPILVKQFLMGKKCPLTNVSSVTLDHRTPVERCQKLGILPASLTELKDAEKYFQALSPNIQSKKRETCKKCIKGEGKYQIEIPQAFNVKDWKEYQPIGAMNCEGCFWSDIG